MNERKYERDRLLLHPEWINDGVIRRKCRQIMRKYAKHGNKYGIRSVSTYLDYINNYPEMTGGIGHYRT